MPTSCSGVMLPLRRRELQCYLQTDSITRYSPMKIPERSQKDLFIFTYTDYSITVRVQLMVSFLDAIARVVELYSVTCLTIRVVLPPTKPMRPSPSPRCTPLRFCVAMRRRWLFFFFFFVCVCVLFPRWTCSAAIGSWRRTGSSCSLGRSGKLQRPARYVVYLFVLLLLLLLLFLGYCKPSLFCACV